MTTHCSAPCSARERRFATSAVGCKQTLSAAKARCNGSFGVFFRVAFRCAVLEMDADPHFPIVSCAAKSTPKRPKACCEVTNRCELLVYLHFSPLILRRLGESVQTVTGSRAAAGSVPNSNASSRENSSSKPRKRVRNPYLDAVIAQEGGRQDEYDDMADFIVCKPGRNYRDVLGLT